MLFIYVIVVHKIFDSNEFTHKYLSLQCIPLSKTITKNICFKNNKVTKYGKNLTENGHLLTQKTSTPSSEWISDNNDDMMAHVFE